MVNNVLEQAKADWRGNRLYIDAQGNWRLKHEGSPRGGIAPYNKALKHGGMTPDKLHKLSKEYNNV